jgi:hypothetical protein
MGVRVGGGVCVGGGVLVAAEVAVIGSGEGCTTVVAVTTAATLASVGAGVGVMMIRIGSKELHAAKISAGSSHTINLRIGFLSFSSMLAQACLDENDGLSMFTL